MSDSTEDMRDSAFASHIPADWKGAIGGYLGGPSAFHTWNRSEWGLFKGNKKLPIWVGGSQGTTEGWAALLALYHLGATPGCWAALDLETRVDKPYVDAFGAVLRFAGFKVMVYGSASTVFGNPPLDGYWVADYAGKGPFMYPDPPGSHTRATQYASPETGSGGQWDSSTVKAYTLNQTTWWV